MNTLIILVSFVASLNLPARQGELGVVEGFWQVKRLLSYNKIT